MKSKSLSSLFAAARSASRNDFSRPNLDLNSLKSLAFRSKPLKSSDSSSEIPEKLRQKSSTVSEDSSKEISREICSLLCGTHDTEPLNLPGSSSPTDGMLQQNLFDIPWVFNRSRTCISQKRKELSRERKQKWVFKNTQSRRLQRLIRISAEKLGAEAALDIFGKLGRETGIKEYNALIGLCIEKARDSNDEKVALDHIREAFQLFISLREHGFQLEEETYGPLFMYLVDTGMVEEFLFLSELCKDGNSGSCFRLGYYEMLLWIKVNNEHKIQELCNSVRVDSSEHSVDYAENYLLALCETDRKMEILGLLEVVDLTKISSLTCVDGIFKSLGRLLMEDSAEKCILAFKASGAETGKLSSFVYSYASSMRNLKVEEVVSKFQNLHEKFEVLPSSSSYEKLITYCCDSLKVREALDLVEQMCQMGLAPSVKTFHPILRACGQSYEVDMVRPIYSVMRRCNLKPTVESRETFNCMINLCVKMKYFEGAYNVLNDLEEMELMPTSTMYNSIMAGHFREKNIRGALLVRKKMEHADVKPDSMTFAYLLNNCECEEDITKYLEEMRSCNVQPTKQVHMALINAYASCGQFGKAKQVVLDQGVPAKNLNEINSALLSALASNGKVLDALEVYEELKEAGSVLEPKAVVTLIEYFPNEGDVNKLLLLLGELNNTSSWCDGCGRVILYYVRYKHLSCAVDLLKQLKEKDQTAADFVCDQVFCQIWETEPVDIEFGMDLLRAVIEELLMRPSRTILDFLLSACVSAKDPRSAHLIWEEYQKASLPYNVLSYLRMYQVLLALGERCYAKEILKKISKDDPHVRQIIKESERTYRNSKPVKKKQIV